MVKEKGRFNPLDNENWEALWQKAKMARQERTGAGPGKDGEIWDKRARHFDRKVDGGEGSARVDAIMDFLEAEKVFSPGMSVIDIGCGQGTITLQLAMRAARVFALDPSKKMLQLLAGKVEEMGLPHVHAILERWQEVDLEEYGWRDKFDLAFASMSPGINDAESLRKMMASSKKYCYLSTFAGRRDRPRDELWELITGKPFEPGDLDIIYPLNLLYTWGYRPSLRFYRHYRSDWFPLEEAVENLLQYLHLATSEEEKARKVVQDYVSARQQDARFFHERDIYHGMLIWDKTVRT